VDVDAKDRNGTDPGARRRVRELRLDAAPNDVESFLERVAIFTGLSPKLRAQLAAGAEVTRLRAGEWLFRRGDPGDSLYLVRSGRLEAVAEAGEPAGSGDAEMIRVLRRGECVGELALLTGSPRSASVRARRDSALVRIDRDQFERLLRDPAFVHGLLSGLGRQLRMSRGLPSGPSGPPMVVAIVGFGEGAPAQEVGHALRERIAHWSKVALLEREGAEEGPSSPAGRSAYAERLDAIERAGERVLLVADHAASDAEWRRFCVEQADRVVVVTRCARPPGDLAPIAACDLLLLGVAEGFGSAEPWLSALRPRTTYRVSERQRSRDLDQVARRLSGRSIGVVLSGGGARGFAHIGALDVLIGSGIEVDRVGGCSMGAIVGGLFASGRSPDEIRALCREEFVERSPLSDYTLPVAGLLRGRRAEAMVRRLFGARRIEELPRSFFCVSSDLVGGEGVVHRWGPAYRLVGASASLPGITPPVPEEGRLLVDGGVLNNLPVEQMAATGEGPVIAVDVTARFEPGAPPRRGRPRAQRLAARAREAVVGSAEPLPALRETLIRSVVLGSTDTGAAAQAHADALVAPQVGDFGMTDFNRLDELVAAGRDAASARLDAIEAAAARADRPAQPGDLEGGDRAHDHAS